MSYTRREWERAWLLAIGNSSPTPFIEAYVIAWTQFETGGPPGAAYNLLNTTEPNTPGVVSNFNSVGVKNYDSFEHGIEANAKVIRNGLYPELEAALVKNNEAALKTPDQGIMHELGLWGTGRAADIANLASRPDGLLFDQAFPGEGPTIMPPEPVPPPAPKPPVPSLAVKLGDKEDFRLVKETIGTDVRYVVVVKHSSEDKLKQAGYI